MLLYVAWIACWQAAFDPHLWTEASERRGSAATSPKAKPDPWRRAGVSAGRRSSTVVRDRIGQIAAILCKRLPGTDIHASTFMNGIDAMIYAFRNPALGVGVGALVVAAATPSL